MLYVDLVKCLRVKFIVIPGKIDVVLPLIYIRLE